MPQVFPGTFTAAPEETFAVFLIGIRINRLLAIRRWFPVFSAMPPMLVELARQRDKGLHGSRVYWSGRVVLLVQYWQSFAHLERFARDPDDLHLPAWRAFNQQVAKSGIVGVFHETYTVTPGTHEAIYSDMPAFGLALATRHVPINRRTETARDRLNGESTATATPAPDV